MKFKNISRKFKNMKRSFNKIKRKIRQAKQFNRKIQRTRRKIQKLTRKQRQLRNAAILGLSMLTMITPFINKINVNAAGTSVIPDYLEEVVVTITPGDRAWNIQKELTPNGDIREMLYYANIVNGKQVGNIHPGEQITFFKIADDK